MLLTLVIAYLLVTIAIGLWAAKRVKTTADFAIAGRHLPLVMIVTTTFATWFGSETVLGIPAKFVQGGLNGVVEDPFGAGTCLILVGLFFASKLYKMTLLTISDYYRERFGRGIEVVCSLIIILSYLGWVSAQVTALGLVFNLLSNEAISIPMGMVLGTASILAYTLFGGMWSVAVTDFIQMIILVVGLSVIAVFAADQAGGADKVIALASSKELFNFLPEPSFDQIILFIAAAITMMFGSIPQQDVFQRVMSAKDIGAATKGPVIGGISYILFAFVPMFLVTSALIIMPETAEQLIKEDPQKVIPTLVMQKMPFVMQVLFFGALLSALKSTASATLLAPSVTFVENIWRQFVPRMSDRRELWTMRVAGAGVQRVRLHLCHRAAGHAHLRHGLGRLPGHAGRGPSCPWWLACTGRGPPRRGRCSRSCWVFSPGACSWPRRRVRPSRPSWPVSSRPGSAWWWARSGPRRCAISRARTTPWRA